MRPSPPPSTNPKKKYVAYNLYKADNFFAKTFKKKIISTFFYELPIYHLYSLTYLNHLFIYH